MSAATRDQRDYSVFDAELSGKPFSLQLLRRLMGWMRPHRRPAIASGLFVVAASVLAVLAPVILSRVVIDGILVPESGLVAPKFGMDTATVWIQQWTGLSPLMAACAHVP